jgi:transcriptional regulator with XRE-family HTH domain
MEFDRAELDKIRSWLEIAQIVARTRLHRGLTQEQVAQRAGTKQSRISEIESMRGNVRFDTLDRVARALGLMVTLRPRTEYVGPHPGYPVDVTAKTPAGIASGQVLAAHSAETSYVPVPAAEQHARTFRVPANR